MKNDIAKILHLFDIGKINIKECEELILKQIHTIKVEWYDEQITDKRMNIIGQNGNDGTHY